MQATDDSALLRQFAETHSDEAFAALVARHINLVYSVALRQAGNPDAAQEITQAVFIILARKAATLRHEKALSSWLFQTTRLTANNFIRGEARRRHREEEAYMQSILNEAGSEIWPRIASLLDDAVAKLREKDRRAILLRFYEGRNLREVGLALGASEAAAEKRVGRALEKLRKLFIKRGVDSTAATIAETISTHSVQAAPVALAKSVTAVAIAKGAAASGSTLTLITGALKIMAWTNTKTAMVAAVSVLLAAGITTITVNTIRLYTLEDRISWSGDQQTLEQQPPVALVRPTKNIMTGSDGKTIPLGNSSLYAATPSGKMAAINMDLASLLRFAYDNGSVDRQLIWVDEEPTNRFDAIYTLGPGRHGQLQQVIRKKTGWSAKLEDRYANTLALKVKTTDATGLKPSGQALGSGRRSGTGGGSDQGVSMAIVARTLSHELQVPVVDQTALIGRFDYQLDLDPMKSLEEKKKIVLDQLGLDLVPTGKTQVIKVLVAQKVK